MKNLEDTVPPYEPAEDALAAVAKIGLSALPVVGPMAVEALAHALQSRQADRQHEFNVLVSRELSAALDRLAAAPSLEDVIQSNDFLAALTGAQRAASETASASKRRRLAAAVAHSGDWAPFARSERLQFLRLAEAFTDLHVWLLHYLDENVGWLASRSIPPLHATDASNQNPLSGVFGVPLNHWWGPFAQATDDLEREHLVAIQTELASWPARQLSARTTSKGRQFLTFLADPASSATEPPEL